MRRARGRMLLEVRRVVLEVRGTRREAEEGGGRLVALPSWKLCCRALELKTGAKVRVQGTLFFMWLGYHHQSSPLPLPPPSPSLLLPPPPSSPLPLPPLSPHHQMTAPRQDHLVSASAPVSSLVQVAWTSPCPLCPSPLVPEAPLWRDW